MNHNHSGAYHKMYNSLQDSGYSFSNQNGSNVSLDNNIPTNNLNSDSRHSSIVELLSLPSSSNVTQTMIKSVMIPKMLTNCQSNLEPNWKSHPQMDLQLHHPHRHQLDP